MPLAYVSALHPAKRYGSVFTVARAGSNYRELQTQLPVSTFFKKKSYLAEDSLQKRFEQRRDVHSEGKDAFPSFKLWLAWQRTVALPRFTDNQLSVDVKQSKQTIYGFPPLLCRHSDTLGVLLPPRGLVPLLLQLLPLSAAEPTVLYTVNRAEQVAGDESQTAHFCLNLWRVHSLIETQCN